MAGAIIAPGLPEMSRFFEGSASQVYVKAILTMPAISIVLFSSLVGLLADRIGRKRLLLLALLVYGLSGVSGLVISNIYILLLSRFVLGIGVAGIMNTATALVGDYFVAEERSRFLGLQASFMSIGGIVFLNVGGVLAEWSWRGPFGLYGLAFIIIPLAIYYLPVVQTTDNTSNENSPSNTLSSEKRKKVIKVFLLSFLGMLFFYLIPVQIPFLLKSNFNLSSTVIGIAISIATLTGALASLSFQKIGKHLSPAKIYALTFICFGMGYLLIGFGENQFFIFLGLAISGAGTGLMMPNGNFILLALLPESIKGKWLGGLTSAIFLGQFLSPLIIATFIEGQGVQSGFLLIAVLSLLLSVLLTVSKSDFRAEK